jgi:hypothetical protein
MPTVVPQDLQDAIDAAAAEFGVPPDLLIGQWIIESRSFYPNPAVNGAGYGGLFGIGQAQALANGFSLYDPTTTLQQARVAAADLASNIAAMGGSIAQGLLRYSGGGYSSVPGETTFGTLPNVKEWPYVLPTTTSPQGVYVQPSTQGSVTGSAEHATQVSTDVQIPVHLGPWDGTITVPNPLQGVMGGLERLFWLLVGILCIILGLWLMVEGSKRNAA